MIKKLDKKNFIINNNTFNVTWAPTHIDLELSTLKERIAHLEVEKTTEQNHFEQKLLDMQDSIFPLV